MLAERLGRRINGGETLQNALQIERRELSVTPPLESRVLGPTLTAMVRAGRGKRSRTHNERVSG